MTKQDFYIYFKNLRQEKNLSFHQLSKLSGVSRPYLSNIENNKVVGKPSAEILSKIAEPLGVTKEYLMKKAGYLEEKAPIGDAITVEEGDTDTIADVDLRILLSSNKFDLHYAGIKLENYQLNGILKIIDTILMMQKFKDVPLTKNEQAELELLDLLSNPEKKMEFIKANEDSFVTVEKLMKKGEKTNG
ncbi:hypothetical protein COJ46_02555 [Bacillus sp. AFS077874]|uniref:helix-turn-helix domain-containing protein n=1 Tax=Bacillus sp. AFS077874 TaxID=2033513 RepID=UPI000BF4C6DC|nr:helix-turn-helix transcriptional regulator [Bacillus sp. AFS077874]PFM82708.1 hypothetical protein COJ46_02555 [Bacillus sp. AFS077874]